jgi:hypothetical protein
MWFSARKNMLHPPLIKLALLKMFSAMNLHVVREARKKPEG